MSRSEQIDQIRKPDGDDCKWIHWRTSRGSDGRYSAEIVALR